MGPRTCPPSPVGVLSPQPTPTLEAAAASGQRLLHPATPPSPRYVGDIRRPSFPSRWPTPDGLPSLRLTMDVQDDLPAVLARCAHGHAGVAARVGGPGTGQREDPAPREDLRPQTEAHMRLRTSQASTHTLSWPRRRARPGSLPDRQTPPRHRRTRSCAQTSGPLLASGQLHRSFEKVL